MFYVRFVTKRVQKKFFIKFKNRNFKLYLTKNTFEDSLNHPLFTGIKIK